MRIETKDGERKNILMQSSDLSTELINGRTGQRCSKNE